MQLFKEHKRKLAESEKVVREKLDQLAAPKPTICPPLQTKDKPPRQTGPPRQAVRRA